MLLDCLQNSRGAYDGRVEQILLSVGDIEVEWRCRVYNRFERRIRLDSFIESSFFRDIFHYCKIQLVFWNIRVCILDLLHLLLGPNGGHDRMSMNLSTTPRIHVVQIKTNPCSNKMSKICAAIKPLPPVRRTRVIV